MPFTNQYDELGDYARDLIKNKARQIIGKAGFRASDLEDIEQELALDLIIRLPKYDPLRARQSTFMARIVEHKISSLISERYAQCRDWRRCQTSLDEPTSSNSASNEETLGAQMSDTAADTPEDTDLLVDIQAALETLPDDMRDLWERLLRGNVRQVAQDLGLSRTTPYSRIKKLRQLLVEAGLDEYLT